MDQAGSSALSSPAKQLQKTCEQLVVSSQKPAFAQRCEDRGVFQRGGTRIFGGSKGGSEGQAGIDDVLVQPFDERGDIPLHTFGMQEHQVDIRERCHVSATISAMWNERDQRV